MQQLSFLVYFCKVQCHILLTTASDLSCFLNDAAFFIKIILSTCVGVQKQCDGDHSVQLEKNLTKESETEIHKKDRNI